MNVSCIVANDVFDINVSPCIAWNALEANVSSHVACEFSSLDPSVISAPYIEAGSEVENALKARGYLNSDFQSEVALGGSEIPITLTRTPASNIKVGPVLSHDDPVLVDPYVGPGDKATISANPFVHPGKVCPGEGRWRSSLGPSCPLVSPGVSSFDSSVESWFHLNEEVIESGFPNYRGLRIPVPSGLCFEAWDCLLSEYEDKEIVDCMRFGWPIGAYREVSVSDGHKRNHGGAREFPAQVEKYLQKEVSFGAILGPFDTNPLPGRLHVSPLNTVPKRGSDDRRVIVDLSFPEGDSVNSAIDKDFYEGKFFDLQFPSVDDLASQIAQLGPGCLAYKRDLSRAYRQIPVCPGDIHHLGIRWNGKWYVDRVLPFGLRSAAMICQRVTDAVSYIMGIKGVNIINYLDDFGGAEIPGKAHSAFDALGDTLRELGLQESLEKASPPSTEMDFLGVLFDTVDMEMKVTPDRMKEVSAILDVWAQKTSATRNELEKLIGKLQFVAKVVRPGRLFIARLLEVLRGSPRTGKSKLSAQSLKDIKWWRRFMGRFNGVSVIGTMLWSEPDEVFASDACLKGVGACTSTEFYHAPFPAFIQDQNLHINALELLGLLVAIRLWAKYWKGLRIRILCDNSTSVTVLNSGKCKDAFMLSTLREIEFCAARNGFEVKSVHIPGVDNRIPDMLSRWEIDRALRVKFLDMNSSLGLIERQVSEKEFRFTHPW